MKKKLVSILVMTLLIGTVVSAVNSVSACTGFTASEGENVLVGNNFDWSLDFNVYMNVLTAEEGKNGLVLFDMYWPWFGDPNGVLPIQGMNDQGLFYDTYFTPYLEPVNSNDKPFFNSEDPDYNKYGWMGILPYCLAKCSTVSEVLDIIDQYNLKDWTKGQCFFVDKNGDSVIIEGDSIIYKDGDFQVITNFLQSHPGLGDYPCSRYDTAVSMLEDMTELPVDYFTSICDATHQSSSIFSNIYDLKQEKIWIHYFYNYNKVYEIDLNEELEKGESRTFLGTLFEPEDNQPPNKPEAPTGNDSGIPGEDIEYRCKKTSDPDGDELTYLFDWGDGTDSGWLPKSMGTTVKLSHNWTEEGNYEVKVKAMDIYGRESEWSDPLSVTMPRNKVINRPFLNFLENHPSLFPLLQELLRQVGL